MTTAYHDPYPFKAPLRSDVLEKPLGQLDAAIAAVTTYGSGVTAALTAQALAGQATLALPSAGFTPGMSVFIGDPGGTFEVRTVNTVPNGASITVTANLSNTYAAGKPVSASPVELVDARGGQLSLGTRLSLYDRWAYDVKRYGAKGDGTTDDTSAIQAAIDAAFAASGGIVFLPPGTYRTTSQVLLKTGVTLVGADEATTLRIDHTGYGVAGLGSVAAGHTLTANAVRGTLTATTSVGGGASYAAGDLVVLQSEAQALEAAGHKKADLYRVLSVAGDVVTFEGSLLDTYLTSDTAKIRKVTPAEKVGVRNMRLFNVRWTTTPTTATNPLIRFDLAADVFVSAVVLEQNNGAGISLVSVYNARVVGNRIEDLRDDIANSIYGYGIAPGHASRQIVVDSNVMRRCRHGFTVDTSSATAMPNYGVVRGVSLVGNSISDCTQAAIDTHEDGDGVAIVGNTIIGGDFVGIMIRCYRASVIGNTIQSVRGTGIQVDTSAEMTLVEGNHVYGCLLNPTSSGGHGIWIASTAVVNGNYVYGSAAHGIYVSVVGSGVTISSNQCHDNGQSAGLTFDGINIDANLNRVSIVGNTCIDSQGVKTQRYGLRFEATFTNALGQVIVDGNNFSLNGTGPYSNAGTGLPVFGVNSPANAPGHRQVKRGTTTGSVGAGAAVDVTVTWPYTFGDTSYTVNANVVEATGVLQVRAIKSKANGSCVVTVFNSSGGGLTGSIDAEAIHD